MGDRGEHRCLAIVHQRDAGPGVFTRAAADRGWRIDEWMPKAGDPPDPAERYGAVMVFGGSMNANEDDAFPWMAAEKAVIARFLAEGTPLLGVCLGSQLLADAAGAPVVRCDRPEIGWFRVEVEPGAAGDPLLGPLAPGFEAFQWHSYGSPLPEGATALAASQVALQAFRMGEATWGIQFHAEVSEADAVSWAVNYAEDPDAVSVGVDPDELAASIRERIGAWNEVGRGLCRRFLDAAAASPR